MPGTFVTFEGIDGCGKTTQLRLLRDYLRQRGDDVAETVEPGGTDIGRRIRGVLLDAANIALAPPAELLLYFASRAQNVAEFIRPALDRGATVLCDRFTDSTRAYQGGGRGLASETIEALDQVACEGLRPHVTVVIDIPLALSIERAKRRNARTKTHETRMDDESMAFHERVRDAYHALAAAEPERFVWIEGDAPMGVVHARVRRRWPDVFEDFLGNRHVVRTLEQMIALERIPQTLLFAGPEGVGKATLARRLGAALLGHAERIEADDLSLPERQEEIAGREKWTAEKRNDAPLQFASHPDFVTFAPDGPLRQLTIHQMRALKEQAAFQPHRGKWRIFLIDQIDRANEQAANSLLKILEEPPPHLILLATAQNAYDLLPTIRSRSVILNFSPLSNDDMRAFAKGREMMDAERRIALSAGSPGLAISLDLAAFEKRRQAMQVLLQVASGESPFAAWLPYSETISRSKNEKLEIYLKLLYELLRDIMLLRVGGSEIRNFDLRQELTTLANRVTTEWIARMVKRVDELQMLVRRNIQKVIALDALILQQR